MLTAADVIRVIEDFAPPSLALPDDPIGLQVGRLDKSVERVWLALDPSPAVIREAVEAHADLLVTHHELLYRPLVRLDTSSWRGQAIAQAVKNDLTIYSAHTNLDIAQGGVNDVLAQTLGLTHVEILDEVAYDLYPRELQGQPNGIGRIGELSGPRRLHDFAQFVREQVGLTHIRFGGDPDLSVARIAVLGGSGGRWADKARLKGAQVLVTSDCDHHQVAEAWEAGLAIVDATHAALERPVLQKLQQVILAGVEEALDVQVSTVGEDPFTWV